MLSNNNKILAISIIKSKCLGCCGCELRCPEVFRVGEYVSDPDDCKSHVLLNAPDYFVSHQEKIELAVNKCSKQAILIQYDNQEVSPFEPTLGVYQGIAP